MKRFAAALLSLLVLVSASASAAGNFFALGERALTVGYAYEDKMENRDEYKGGKLAVQGRWAWSVDEQEPDPERVCCARPSKPTLYRGVVDAELRYGFESSDIEVVRVGVIPWARAWDPADDDDSRWDAERDTLEFGTTRYINDDPLELDSYLEVAATRLGRGVSYRARPDSPNVFSIEGDAAVGWAWAESTNQAYQNVSNPYAGVYIDAAWNNSNWGEIYGTARFVNGFSFSNPTRGNPTAREAYVRAGYRRGFGGLVDGRQQWLLDVHFHKRSFYFDEGGLPELYTWVRAYVAEVRYRF